MRFCPENRIKIRVAMVLKYAKIGQILKFTIIGWFFSPPGGPEVAVSAGPPATACMYVYTCMYVCICGGVGPCHGGIAGAADQYPPTLQHVHGHGHGHGHGIFI